MDHAMNYAALVEQVVQVYPQIPPAHDALETLVMIDAARTRFIVLVMGWQGHARVHYCAAHIELRDGLVWVHEDRIDELVHDLVASGIPLDALRLAYRHYEPLTVVDLLHS